MTKNKPYVYHIAWSSLDVHYYGVRFSAGCSPDDLWNPYRTSSEYVRRFIRANGEPDIIEVRKVFDTVEDALKWETRFLVKIDAARHANWLNRHNGARNFATTKESAMKAGLALRGRKFGTKYHNPKTGEITHVKEGKTVPKGYVKGGPKQSPETIAARVIHVRGKPKTEDHKRKMSEAKLGTKRTAEATKNAADAKRGMPLGKKYYNAELDVIKHIRDGEPVPAGFVPGARPGQTRTRSKLL